MKIGADVVCIYTYMYRLFHRITCFAFQCYNTFLQFVFDPNTGQYTVEPLNNGHGIKFVDLVLSIVERYLIQSPFLGVSVKRDSTVRTF